MSTRKPPERGSFSDQDRHRAGDNEAAVPLLDESGTTAGIGNDRATLDETSPRKRQEKGNRGPDEESGFGQGA
jgi:hypothetical protein